MDLFLSYAHKDAALAKALLSVLDKGGQTVWFDENLRVGPQWKQQLSDKIHSADAIVLALTPAWLESPYCQWEFITAAEQGKKVIPVLLAHHPDGTKLSVPNRISQYQWADFSGGFGDAAKVQKFLDDLLVLAKPLHADDVAHLNKDFYARAIEQQSQMQVNQHNTHGNNVNVSGNGNTVAGGNIDQSRQNIRVNAPIQGGNVVIGGRQEIGGNLTITMGDLSQTIQRGSSAPTDKEILQTLVNQLQDTLAVNPVPEANKAAVEKIVTRTTELVSEVSAAEIDREAVDSKASLLKKAAENVAAVLPTVIGIATQIVTQALKMAGVTP